MEKQALEKLKKARAHLLLSSIYDQAIIGSISIKFPFVAAESFQGYKIETAATNGMVIVFNPEYIDKLSLKECMFLIAHETMHSMFLHHTRRAGRDFEKWNIAGDHIINDILISDQIGTPINGALFDPKFHGLNIEYVYRLISDQGDQPGSSDQPGDQGADPGSSDQPGDQGDKKTIDSPAGGVIDAPADFNTADLSADIKNTITSAINMAEKAFPGSGKGSRIKKLLEDIRAPKVSWQNLLKQWFDGHDKTDFSFSRPRYSDNYILPGLHSEALGKIIVAMDVSKSVLEHAGAIESFQSEIITLRDQFQFETELIYFHSEIERVENFQRHEKIEIKIIETGGTQLQPVLDYISDNGLINQISGLLVFTDMEIFDFPEQEPGYKILFIQYGDQDYYKTDIGQTIKINNV